jgi:hypothetical protein
MAEGVQHIAPVSVRNASAEVMADFMGDRICLVTSFDSQALFGLSSEAEVRAWVAGKLEELAVKVRTGDQRALKGAGKT